MDECFKCGIPNSRVMLYDAVSDEGIVKICERCSRNEDIPIIKKPTDVQLKEAQRRKSVYEMLSKSSGTKPREELPERNFTQEITLRQIVDRNYKNRTNRNVKPHPELIDNFHWALMRGRRMKKVTQQQMARDIGEPESAIRMAEQGVLPDDSNRLVNKLEDYLGVKIVRSEFVRDIKPERPRYFSFDMQENKELTIEDIRNMRMLEERKRLEEEAREAEEAELETEKQEEENKKFNRFPFKI